MTAYTITPPLNTFAIRRIYVNRLFDHFSYDLTLELSSNADRSRLFIIYGDNGSGKTTLLNMVFHILSPEDNKGHRTFLARKPFSSFGLEFFDGTSICAHRDGSALLGTYDLTIISSHHDERSVHLQTDEENAIHILKGKASKDYEKFLKALRSFGITVHLLADDRKALEDASSTEDEDEIIAIP